MRSAVYQELSATRLLVVFSNAPSSAQLASSHERQEHERQRDERCACLHELGIPNERKRLATGMTTRRQMRDFGAERPKVTSWKCYRAAQYRSI